MFARVLPDGGATRVAHPPGGPRLLAATGVPMFLLMRALTYAALFSGLVFFLLPRQVLRWAGVDRPPSPGLLQLTGLGLAVLGGSFAIWCVLTLTLVGHGTPAPFDPPKRLVVRGPYRFVRNPMYCGAFLALCGAGIYYRSIPLVLYALGFLGVMELLVRCYEEPNLRRLFVAEYESYCRHVRRWWPSMRGRP